MKSPMPIAKCVACGQTGPAYRAGLPPKARACGGCLRGGRVSPVDYGKQEALIAPT